jgi:hypothetical protein
MEIIIRNLGYLEMTMRACEQDLKDVRSIMTEAADDLTAPIERRAVAQRMVTLMDKQREMPS